MCIAIMSQAGITVPKERLEQSFRINDDGAGFMYAENNQLHIEKGFMDFDSFYAAYKPHEEKPIAIHFRIKTYGDLNEENTHPFQVGQHLGMVHNGIINAVARPDKSKSDTYWFNQKILVPIYKRDSRFIFKEHFKELVKEYIGWSKLVFLNNKGHHTIVNEDKGVWDEGVWYSNTSYRAAKKQQQNRRTIAPFTDKNDEKKQELFTIGQRVKVEYDFNKSNNGFGVVDHFTGGQMLGIKMDGQQAIRLIHISFIYPVEEVAVPNVYKKDDWVVKKDNPELIGEVQGTIGTGVVVRWLNAMGVFAAPDFVVSADKLDYWWNSNEISNYPNTEMH